MEILVRDGSIINISNTLVSVSPGSIMVTATSIVILVESHQEFTFFMRFKKSFLLLNHTLIIVTDKFSIFLDAKYHKRVPVHLLKPVECDIPIPDLSSTVDAISASFSPTEASIYYQAVYDSLMRILQGHMPVLIFVWGGNTVGCFAAKEVARIMSVPILYFDQGNSPGKIFVDPCGTNLQSFLYANQHILDEPPSLDRTEKAHSPSTLISVRRQSNPKFARTNFFIIFDIVYSLLARLPYRGVKNLYEKLKLQYNPLYRRDSVQYDIGRSGYYLIAVAHSFELKKEHQNLSFIGEIFRRIREEARIADIDLLIKLHPREDDPTFVEMIRALSRQYQGIIVAHPGRALIMHATKIFLFNTSLAIEAILQNKNYQFVDRSLYESFTRSRTLRYLHDYLIAAEEDGEDNFSLAAAEEVLNRTTKFR
jgi:capsular polysaccharide export protein